MKTILETNRLLLREFNISDAESFYELNLNPNVIKYTGNSAFKDIDEAKAFLENYSDYQRNGFGRWAVINKSTEEFLGWCGLKYDEDLNETDIGFRFFEHFWNKGFATEMAQSLVKIGFEQLGFESIVCFTQPTNKASQRVMEKSGFEYEKTISEKTGPYADMEFVFYRLTKNSKIFVQSLLHD